MTTTKIGITTSTLQTSQIPTINSDGPARPTAFEHALLVDLSAFEDPNRPDYEAYEQHELDVAYHLFIEHLEQIVKTNGLNHPPLTWFDS
jgi:hypothetical protein